MTSVRGDKPNFDFAAYGFKDGKCMYGDLQKIEINRRQLVLKAAKQLHSDPENTAIYVEGLEAGMKSGGAAEATARRLRYEVAAIITSYGITVELEMPKTVNERTGKEAVAKERVDFRNLEIQETWQGLVNLARDMRNVATSCKRNCEGLPLRIGRGNHTVRTYNDTEFDKLREALIERTAPTQALDLLDAAIIAVSNAYSTITSVEIDSLREIEQKIHDKVNVQHLNGSMRSNLVNQRVQLVAKVR